MHLFCWATCISTEITYGYLLLISLIVPSKQHLTNSRTGLHHILLLELIMYTEFIKCNAPMLCGVLVKFKIISFKNFVLFIV